MKHEHERRSFKFYSESAKYDNIYIYDIAHERTTVII